MIKTAKFLSFLTHLRRTTSNWPKIPNLEKYGRVGEQGYRR